MTGARAWLILAASIVAYEIAAPDDQLLSEAADRAIVRRPILTRCAVALVAAHVANLIPARIDPIHQLTRLRRC
ncbi:hypothetical protein G4X40_19815 [Rhodococcus sp. D2-41]|uniref:DUF7427 family protein n=1 Tax=Speluncibacter jeojiensis TaxID=2710754 RepID=UPI00240EC6E9|nr:hypothetical protein [Rhodococcus sp. D2-41]MDG3012391.1 hypothetical protein [Rhodococcus sp. D2-41]